MKAKDQKLYNELLKHARDNLDVASKIVKDQGANMPVQLQSMLALNYGAANASLLEAVLMRMDDVSDRLKLVEASLGLLGTNGEGS